MPGYINTEQTYNTGDGKTNATDNDQTNNPNTQVINNNDGTSTVIYEDGTTTTVSNEPISGPVTVDSNTNLETGKQLQEGDEGYISPDSEDYSSTTYQYGSGGGPDGMNPYLGSDATTYDQVQENKESVKEAARGQGELDAYKAAVAAGIDPTRIVYGADYNTNTVYSEDDVIVGTTGYTADGTFVYTNTDPLLGNVEDGNNFYPGEQRQATSGILIRPDGSTEQINDLSNFTNPGDGSVIELDNGYSVINDPNNGINNYGGVGMYAESPDMGVAYEKDPAIRSPEYVYQTLSVEDRNAAENAYNQAIADSIARGDIPSEAYAQQQEEAYENYLAELEAAKKEEEEKEAEEAEEEEETTEESPPLYVEPGMYSGGLVNLTEGMNVPNMQQPMQQPMQQLMQNPLEQEVIQAVLGSHPNPDSVIQAFIQQFGIDAFLQLRDKILKQQVPNAQTEGKIEGAGGGMDDLVMGQIGNQSAVAVSPGEYIVPADVVSMLGDGDSDNGSDKLDGMLDRVRVEKTGTNKQAKPLGNKKIMAA
tara:strand:+ start:4529 stop:6133 length:1605 start_codon:yes stop_codon:yes gene_type:complete